MVKSIRALFVGFFIVAVSADAQLVFSGKTSALLRPQIETHIQVVDSSFQFRIVTGRTPVYVYSENEHFTIRHAKGYLLQGAAGDTIAITDKKVKSYLLRGDTLTKGRCKGWTICLVDRNQNMVACGRYVLRNGTAKIEISVEPPYVSIVPLIGYQLVIASKTLAESNSLTSMLASIL